MESANVKSSNLEAGRKRTNTITVPERPKVEPIFK